MCETSIGFVGMAVPSKTFTLWVKVCFFARPERIGKSSGLLSTALPVPGMGKGIFSRPCAGKDRKRPGGWALAGGGAIPRRPDGSAAKVNGLHSENRNECCGRGDIRMT